jgi:hypothetical protein
LRISKKVYTLSCKIARENFPFSWDFLRYAFFMQSGRRKGALFGCNEGFAITTVGEVRWFLLLITHISLSLRGRTHPLPVPLFGVDLTIAFVLIYFSFTLYPTAILQIEQGGYNIMATKMNFILKVQDSKLADIQKALKDANITVVSIMEIHKEEA